MADFTLEPRQIPGADCGDVETQGRLSTRYDYIVKNIQNEGFYDETCEPWLHGNAQINNLQVNTEINGSGNVNVTGNVSSNGGVHVLSAKKDLPFDMPHPNKPGWRLRHVCIEV